MGTIVVGVDDSAGSDVALRWALSEARLRHATLRVVHAYQPPKVPFASAGLGAAGGMAVPALFTENAEHLRHTVEVGARHVIDEAVRRADGGSLEEIEIERAPIEGPAAQALIESARDAELLVLGAGGHTGLAGLVLGSVSRQCAQHPPCPVVILPLPERAEASANEQAGPAGRRSATPGRRADAARDARPRRQRTR